MKSCDFTEASSKWKLLRTGPRRRRLRENVSTRGLPQGRGHAALVLEVSCPCELRCVGGEH